MIGISSYHVFITDMQKFPLRMKDNDLLVTELYKDPAGDRITALSVYLTPKTSKGSGNKFVCDYKWKVHDLDEWTWFTIPEIKYLMVDL